MVRSRSSLIKYFVMTYKNPNLNGLSILDTPGFNSNDSELRYEGRPIPALQGLDRSDRVIYLGALSKVLPFFVRISYLVLPDPLMDMVH